MFDVGQLIGKAINWITRNDKKTSATNGTKTEETNKTDTDVESTETVRYRETTGIGSRYGNMILPDFKVKDTVVPESKASEVYKQLDKKFKDDWQKQTKSAN